MRTSWRAGLAVAVSALLAPQAYSEDIQWHAATVRSASPTAPGPVCASAITLGRPQAMPGGKPSPPANDNSPPLASTDSSLQAASSGAFRLVARAQSQDVAQGQPPPPPPPPPPGAVVPGSREEGYNCGVATDAPAATHPFLEGGWGFVKGVPGAVAGVFQSSPGRCFLQSDIAFPQFISPVSNPFFFEDPRALTEVRPVFIYQDTSHRTPFFAGGDATYFGLQGRVAFTDRLSLVVSKLGWIWTDIHDSTPEFHSHEGFSEIQLGPKVTVIRNDCSGTLLALGWYFDIPTGPHKVFQDTGNLSMAPYLSFGQNFLKSGWGSFNFLNTTGYDFSTDNRRSEFFYTSFHLDYDVANLHRVYPLIELNWFYYTAGGNSEPPLGFEGRDLFNFGIPEVSGHSDLSLALGLRYKFSERFQLGFAAEFPLDGRRDLNDFRLTADMIVRY
jgi:hypothetical protein